eukprot:scaffold22785_cov72-Phaeocystis_antarctica.AAC.7
MRRYVEPNAELGGAAIVRQREVAHVDFVLARHGFVIPVQCRAGVTRLYPHRVCRFGRVDHPQVGNQVVERIVVEVRCHTATMHGAEAVDSAVTHSRAVERAVVGVEHERLIACVEVAADRLGRAADECAGLINVELCEATMTLTAASKRGELVITLLGEAARLAA